MPFVSAVLAVLAVGEGVAINEKIKAPPSMNEICDKNFCPSLISLLCLLEFMLPKPEAFLDFDWT